MGYVKKYYDGAIDYSLASRVTVTLGQDVVGIDFTLEAGGSISGVVYQADGTTPIANADVSANSYYGGGGNGYARTGADGTYGIQGLPAGDQESESAFQSRQ